MARFTFQMVKLDEQEEDFSLLVFKDQEIDGVACHDPMIAQVMHPLDIMGEDDEGCFSGYYSERFPNALAVKAHLQSFGWVEEIADPDYPTL